MKVKDLIQQLLVLNMKGEIVIADRVEGDIVHEITSIKPLIDLPDKEVVYVIRSSDQRHC